MLPSLLGVWCVTTLACAAQGDLGFFLVCSVMLLQCCLVATLVVAPFAGGGLE